MADPGRAVQLRAGRLPGVLVVAAVLSLLCVVAYGTSSGSPLSGKALSFGNTQVRVGGSRGGVSGLLSRIRSFFAGFGLRPGHGLPGSFVLIIVVIAAGVAVLVTIAILMTMVGWLIAKLRLQIVARREAQAPLLVPDAEEAAPDLVLRRFAEAVARGLTELDEGDPRAAVIACWLRLQDAAAAAGTLPIPTETASEFVVRVLVGLRVRAEPLHALADLFDEARFSAHTVDDDMRAEAVVALGSLQHEIGSR